MDMPHVEPYGFWKSKISSEMVASHNVKLNFADIESDTIYFEEMRPNEKGRTVIVKQKIGQKALDLLPEKYNARTRVHEYGGKSSFVNKNQVYFVNFNDQNIYVINEDLKIFPITNEENCRYADIVFSQKRNCLYCVQEKHLKTQVENSIVKIDLKNQKKTTIVNGFDFFASLSLSLDEKNLAFISWNHPNMPWDGTNLMVCEVDSDKFFIKKVAGGENESIFQPSFGPDNHLYFVSDKTNFWNLYVVKESIKPIVIKDAEFAFPLWQLGYTSYCFFKRDEKYFICCTYSKDGKDFLAEIDLQNNKLTNLDFPFTYYCNLKSFNDKIVCTAASPIEESCFILIDMKKKKYEIIKKVSNQTLAKEDISLPKQIEYISDGKKVFAFYYPPKNSEYRAPKNDLPPLIVKSHGGPTGQSKAIFNMEVQFWTSRGYALLDVNYSGSSGYGKDYRDRLNGNWGIYDVDDCCDGALFLVDQKLAHPKKLIIRGGSAGGYTTLAALAFKKVFNAGASYFGVSDLESMTLQTHKFEAHYLERLIGPYPSKKDLFFQRSPINFVNNFSCPIILFQGEDDMIVPKNQAEMLYSVLIKKKIPTAYLLFSKEGHGFRNAKNIQKALDAEHYFYSKIFNFSIEGIDPVKIENL
jgi:dipeptidyl aminopeptidase/acylaminoacyl peptidase